MKCGETSRFICDQKCVNCHRLRGRIWSWNNPEKVRAKKRRQYWNNPEKKRATRRRQYWNNPEKAREYSRKWRKANPEKQKAIKHRRRALMNSADSQPYNFADIALHYENTCLRCGRSDLPMTVDHIIPISLGGDDIGSNIQPLCGPCNSAKGAKYIDYRSDAGPERWIQPALF